MRAIPTLKISISGVRGVVGDSLTPALVARFGCTVVRTPVGEAHVAGAMLREHAVIGGEGNDILDVHYSGASHVLTGGAGADTFRIDYPDYWWPGYGELPSTVAAPVRITSIHWLSMGTISTSGGLPTLRHHGKARFSALWGRGKGLSLSFRTASPLYLSGCSA